jgi:uncharacterized ferritin-like protein (DUF455 family)
MNDEPTAAAADAGKPKAPLKVGLWEMVHYAETEAERMTTWERVLHSEGQDMDPSMMRRRLVFQRMAKTLDLLMQHELEFLKIVTAARHNASYQRERGAEARDRRSTEPLSELSMSESTA